MWLCEQVLPVPCTLCTYPVPCAYRPTAARCGFASRSSLYPVPCARTLYPARTCGRRRDVALRAGPPCTLYPVHVPCTLRVPADRSSCYLPTYLWSILTYLPTYLLLPTYRLTYLLTRTNGQVLVLASRTPCAPVLLSHVLSHLRHYRYSLYPVPCARTLYPACPLASSQLQVFPVPCTLCTYPVPCTLYHVPCTLHPAPHSRQCAPPLSDDAAAWMAWRPAAGAGYRVHDAAAWMAWRRELPAAREPLLAFELSTISMISQVRRVLHMRV